MRSLVFTLSVLVLASGGRVAFADPAKPTYDEDVVAIFKQHCTNCHGNDKQKSDLNLATYSALQKGGSSGVVVVPCVGEVVVVVPSCANASPAVAAMVAATATSAIIALRRAAPGRVPSVLRLNSEASSFSGLRS